MRIPRASSNCVGLTLVELLAVVIIIFLFIALLDPFGAVMAKKKALLITCMSNQKQIGLGFIMWQGDHNGKFPWELSTATNGTMELIANGSAAAQFQAASDYLPNFNVYHCPADTARPIATNYLSFTDGHLSYFVNVDAEAAPAVLTGDRHLRSNGTPVQPDRLLFTNGITMDWTHELHYINSKARGALAFADGHAEAVVGSDLTSVFTRQGTNEQRLLVP